MVDNVIDPQDEENSAMGIERTPRELDTRERAERPKTWRPASLLPNVNSDLHPGLEHRYVRVSMMGVSDAVNVSSKLREGWEACKLDDYPEMMGMTDFVVDERFKDNIIIGGQMLCCAPSELIAQRTEYYRNQTKSQMDAVNRNYMTESDPRMETFNESTSSRGRFGSGN